MPPTVVVIPVKSFVLGKQRLSGALDPATRERLGRAMAERAASTVVSAGLMPLVVTADPEVAEWSTRTGFPSVADPGQGLDAAAATGVEWARSSTSTWIVMHSDLPLLETSDLLSLSAPLEEGRSVIAPSADGGTSAMGSRDEVSFSFGMASFHRHLPAMDDPVIVARSGLLLDLDTPADLKAAMETNRGSWLRELIPGGSLETYNLY